jgi:hypothetical protein
VIKQLYRRWMNSVENRAGKINRLKFVVSEHIAIERKKKLIKDVVWTAEQQRVFEDYWLRTAGRKIRPYWHKLYQKCNSVFTERYFPEYLFTTNIEPKLNPYSRCRVLEDKNLVEILFGSVVKVPETIALCSCGICYDGNRSVITRDKLIETLNNAGDVVIKVSVGSSSGKGVQLFSIKEGKDADSNKTISEILADFGSDFIVQKKVLQSSTFHNLYPNSVNTIRVITYVCDGCVYHAPLSMRMGTGGSKVDNIHSGGLVICVNDDGRLSGLAYRLGYGDCFDSYSKHPDTGVVFSSVMIEGIEKLIKIAYKCHGRLPGVGCVSWDFTMNSEEQPVLIEANQIGQSIWFPQMVSGRPFFGVNTEEIIKMLKIK